MNWIGTLRRRLAHAAGGNLKGPIILTVSPLLVVTWKYFGSPEFYRNCLAEPASRWLAPATGAGLYVMASCFLLLGLIPALIVKLGFRENLADYGVRFGDRFRTVRSFLVFAPVFVVAAWVASRIPCFVAEYPLTRNAGSSTGLFALHACTYVLFYLGWEFHFRGFMQYGLRGSIGPAYAILIQTMASVLAHLGKPAMETYGALIVGILWGYLAFRTRSLLSGLLQHALLGIALDYFICFA